MLIIRQGAAKVQEECAELIQALAKYETHGPDSAAPGSSYTNKAHAEDEMGDVLAAIQYAAERMGLDRKRIAARMEKKYALYCKWERDELEGGK